MELKLIWHAWSPRSRVKTLIAIFNIGYSCVIQTPWHHISTIPINLTTVTTEIGLWSFWRLRVFIPRISRTLVNESRGLTFNWECCHKKHSETVFIFYGIYSKQQRFYWTLATEKNIKNTAWLREMINQHFEGRRPSLCRHTGGWRPEGMSGWP